MLDAVMPEQHWRRLRDMAIKLLRARAHRKAAELLEQTPFELRDGTNGFGDDFSILYWSAPLEEYVQAAEWVESHEHGAAFEDIAKTIGEVASTKEVRFIAVGIETAEGPDAVENPNLAVRVDSVERALKDAQQLIATTGATSGVDRVHTALHGYLKALCDRSGISHADDASITALFKLLRKQHPALQTASSSEATKALMGLATVVDVLDTVRNRKSLAHPNANLLEEPEAMLMINSVRTLLHYLNAKDQGN